MEHSTGVSCGCPCIHFLLSVSLISALDFSLRKKNHRITGSNEYFLSEGTTDEFAATGYRFSIPSSHAFVDLDGDCRSDLVFTVEDPCSFVSTLFVSNGRWIVLLLLSHLLPLLPAAPGANCLHGPPQYMEIWLNSRGRFTFHSRKPLPEGTQQLTFADFGAFCPPLGAL